MPSSAGRGCVVTAAILQEHDGATNGTGVDRGLVGTDAAELDRMRAVRAAGHVSGRRSVETAWARAG